MQALRETLRHYWKLDRQRYWRLKMALALPFERAEFTRLSSIRNLMQTHKTYDKEKTLFTQKDGEEQSNKFIWSYMIKKVNHDH